MVTKQREMLHVFSTDFDACLKDVDYMAFRTTGWDCFGGGQWCEGGKLGGVSWWFVGEQYFTAKLKNVHQKFYFVFNRFSQANLFW